MKTLNAILIICVAIILYMFISNGYATKINTSRSEKENRINNIDAEIIEPVQNQSDSQSSYTNN